MIKERCEEIENLNFSLLKKKEVVTYIKLFLHEQKKWRKVEVYNFSESDSSEVRYWLEKQYIKNSYVPIVWFSINEGIRLLYIDFVIHFNELWFPSSDDILIPFNDDTVLTINHEEVFTIYQNSVT